MFEDVAFDKGVGVGADIEGVAGVVEPVVVKGMPVAIIFELGGAARGVVDVVVGKGYLVIIAQSQTDGKGMSEKT